MEKKSKSRKGKKALTIRDLSVQRIRGGLVMGGRKKKKKEQEHKKQE